MKLSAKSTQPAAGNHDGSATAIPDTHLPITRAIESDDLETVRDLLSKSQSKCVQCLQTFRPDGTWYLVDPLCEAAWGNSFPIVQAMLDREPNHTVGLGQYNGEIKGAHCLAWAASNEMREMLMEGGADPATIESLDVPHPE